MASRRGGRTDDAAITGQRDAGQQQHFLPASAPSEQASVLAAPFGTSNLTPVPVAAAAAGGRCGDQAWLNGLQAALKKVPTVVKVQDLGASSDGQAEQIQVLSDVSRGT